MRLSRHWAWIGVMGIPEGELNRIQIELPGRAKDIAICGSAALSYFAVLENGDLYAWGDNQYGP